MTIKKLSYSKILPMAALAFTLGACSDGTKKAEDPTKVAEEHNEQKFDNDKEKTADFMVYAADLNLQEIELGELAMGNGYDPEVKKMGKMMAADHHKALDELKKMAAERTVSLPESVSDEHKKDCDKLSKKTKKDFDKDYCDMMVDGHEDAIKRFEKEAEEGKDEGVRQWAFQMLPSLRTHLDHALECQKKCDNKNDTAVVIKNGAKTVDNDKERDAAHRKGKTDKDGKKDW
jgi:putative membrane protein